MDNPDSFRDRFEALEPHTQDLKPRTRIVQTLRRLRGRVAAVVALGMALPSALSAQANVVQCGGGDVACLIAAIDQANANPDEDVIELMAGTYTLTGVHNDTDGPNGLPSIRSRITLVGTGARQTILERVPAVPAAPPPEPCWAVGHCFRLLHVAAEGVLTISGVTVRRGYIDSENGGGIYSRGQLLLQASVVAHNTAESAGGGLLNGGGQMQVVQSTIERNDALDGAGIISDGDLMVSRSSIIGNTAFLSGGGVLVSNGFSPSVSVRIVNSTIADNSAKHGGGIYVTRFGGEGEGPRVAIESTTIADNFAYFGGGIYHQPSPTLGTVEIVNTILANFTLLDLNDCAGYVTSLDHNVISTLNECFLTPEAHDIIADPQLAPFQRGLLPGRSHYPLQPPSPAIDAGDAGACTPRDQLGQRRVGICDIGAVEF